MARQYNDLLWSWKEGARLMAHLRGAQWTGPSLPQVGRHKRTGNTHALPGTQTQVVAWGADALTIILIMIRRLKLHACKLVILQAALCQFIKTKNCN